MVEERLREWLRQQPDLTLGELQRELRERMQVPLSIPRLWVVLRQMKLRLKKSHSTPRSRTLRKTGSAARFGGRR